ncbi:S41 family peptidase [Cohnella endophytica]|nr:S41 family peptidase [Cohnella endophytica]
MNYFRKFRLTLALLLSVALFAIGSPIALGASAEQVQEVRDLLEQYHLSKPDDTVLSGTEMDKMVESLHDPYTQYFDDEQWSSFNSALEQTFVGIGIVISEEKGIVYVQEVIAGSPAEASGLQAGDALAAADGKSLKGLSSADVQKELRGVEGTSVKLTVNRGGKTLSFIITRRAVQLPAVAARMLDNNIGYLSLSGFSSNSGNEVKTELEKLEKNGLSALVFDLRNNGGGYVNAAQFIAGLFIEKGILAHMKDRDGIDHPLEVNGSKKTYPVIMLVNENSASASELLSGALQDYGVAKLVGTKTYGKGVVQSILSVKSGGVLKVTVQEYYTPAGRKVDKVGLTPNVVVNGAAEQFINAYRLAGGQKVTVTTASGLITVNGVRMAEPGITLQDKSVWYVNIKLAASILGAKLTYDTKNHEYTLSKGTQLQTIKTNDSHLRIKDGQSNIDVRLLMKKFAGFSFSSNGETLKMVASK